jgi:Glycosyl transferase family 11
MIRIILLGRTGNNLFQYAMGRVLSKRHGVPLVLDGSWYNRQGWSEVSHFLRLPIQARVVRRCSLATRALRNLTGNHYWEFAKWPIIREALDTHAFDARHLEAPADCVLFGYFQSPLYFDSIANELRQEFVDLIEHAITNGPGQKSLGTVAMAFSQQPLLSSLSAPESVAVHVRRGDFLHHPAFQVCDSTYYQNAMETMRAHVKSPKFFLFSDDPAWCRNAFTDPDMEVIDSGKAGANPLHDLYLMSQASHHIIANSTYSWWAAWLGKKQNQVVLTPPRWFTKDITAPISEKLCPGWTPVT